MPDATPVQTPLTLILTIKSERAFRELAALLEGRATPGLTGGEAVAAQELLRPALDRIGTVHFARFVFLENNTKLAIITTFDGDFDTYINDFVEDTRVAEIFDAIAERISPAPPTPVANHRREFIEFVKRHDVKAVPPFYSAYPRLTVKQILTLALKAET
jgi:hypothetical protein